ncbi:MAG: CocE/NonD family hydrolase [Hymenobacter sp.]|nr:MAG: CocE/NonD family hydrolase [Hymenobacter sp.]
METPFFNYYPKGKGTFNPAEATIFDTGLNEWKNYAAWPPKATENRSLYLQQNGLLAAVKEAETMGLLSSTAGSDFIASPGSGFIAPSTFGEYLGDPPHPVPYTAAIQGECNNEYMIEDQRFAAERPDMLTYQTEPLSEDLTVAGPLGVDLWVSPSGTDADFMVKLIDVLPDDTPNPAPNPQNGQLAGAQRLVRAGVFRGRFRHSSIMPGSADFQNTTIRIYHEPGHASVVQLPVLRQ